MTGTLTVVGSGPVCEIVVRDQNLRIVRADVNKLQAELEQGIYRVDVWVPGTTDVAYVGVRDDRLTTHERADIIPDSIVPVAGIRSANDVHAELARAVSHTPVTRLSNAGQQREVGRILLFARSGGAPRFVGPWVNILGLSGNFMAGLELDGVVNARHGCAGLSVDLEPGHYVLHHFIPNLGTRAQIVRVVAGYETQVFASWTEDHIDLGSAVVCMVAVGSGFDPTNVDRYLRSELVIRSLTTGRPAPTPDGDPLAAMVRLVVRRLGEQVKVPATDAGGSPTNGVQWTDLQLVDGMVFQLEGTQDYGPPALSMALPYLDDLLDRIPARWPRGLVTAPTQGSVWARWNFDEAPLPGAATDRKSHPEPSLTPQLIAGPTQVLTSSRLRMVILDGQKVSLLAAASPVLAEFSRGRHIDVALWAADDPASLAPRATIRVRMGAVARVYRTHGDVVRYDAALVPTAATESLVMSLSVGEDLLEHLQLHLRWAQGD